jgi:hypothetical protein
MNLVRRVVPVLGLLFLAAIMVAIASERTSFHCDRETGLCKRVSADLFSREEHAFAVQAVRDVRLVDELGKEKNHADIVLVHADGNEVRLGEDKSDKVRARHRAIAAFFAPGGPPRYDEQTQGSPIFYAFALAALAAAVYFGLFPPERLVPRDAGNPELSAETKRWRNIFIVAFLVLAVLGGVVAYVVSDRTQGTLELECQTRCRFQGAECLPGGSRLSPLDPGDYTIEIWTATGEAKWRPEHFTIRVGETTRFVCKP